MLPKPSPLMLPKPSPLIKSHALFKRFGSGILPFWLVIFTSLIWSGAPSLAFQSSTLVTGGPAEQLEEIDGGATEIEGPDKAAGLSPPVAPLLKPWGYPLSAFDTKTRAQDDFYRYANGGWLDSNAIPAIRSGIGFSIDMSERVEARLSSIMQNLLNTRYPRGSDGQKIRDLYLSYMNGSRVERLGFKPFARDFEQIRLLETHKQVAAILAKSELGLAGPFRSSVTIDVENPDHYALAIAHDGLSMPDRSYYLRADKGLEVIRSAFKDYIYKLLVFEFISDPKNRKIIRRVSRSSKGALERNIGQHIGDLDQRVDALFTLEKKIAELHWTRARRRDATLTYNPMTRRELEALAPDFPWAEFLKPYGAKIDTTLIVREETSFPNLAELFAQTPIEVWRDYIFVHYISANAEYMPEKIAQLRFSFFDRAISGRTAQRQRDKRALGLVDREFAQSLGRFYVEAFFPEESRTLMLDMFETIRTAYKTRIENLSWMSADTKKEALFKLSKIRATIGYPEIWRDYSRVRIRRDDLFGNIKNIRRDDFRRDLTRLGSKVNKSEWDRGPQTVNAFYNPARNEVFVPAGYIQSPLFDPAADSALNYGAIGAIIGHGIGHAFDDQGSKYDADGKLRSWWRDDDRLAFHKLGDRLAAQFDQYEVLDGLHVNGRQTLGENIGDLAGMIVAYDAYILSLQGKPANILKGRDGEVFTGTQRFFLGRAQGRRFKRTEAALRRRLLAAPHSPMALRVNGVIRNMDEWYKAFDVKPGDGLYLAPEDRIRIW